MYETVTLNSTMDSLLSRSKMDAAARGMTVEALKAETVAAVHAALQPDERKLLLYLGAEVSEWRDSPGMCAQRAAWAARSAVREWHTVTVAFAFSNRLAIGLPTMLDLPIIKSCLLKDGLNFKGIVFCIM